MLLWCFKEENRWNEKIHRSNPKKTFKKSSGFAVEIYDFGLKSDFPHHQHFLGFNCPFRHHPSKQRTDKIAENIQISKSSFESILFPQFHSFNADSCYLSAERAAILSVLGDFEFLDDLSEGGTISCSVFSGDTNFLSSLSHFYVLCVVAFSILFNYSSNYI